jgi:hypothetical protein
MMRSGTRRNLMLQEASWYEIRPALTGSGIRIVRGGSGETVVLDGRVLEGLSFRAARDVVALLERIDAFRAERRLRVMSSNDLAAILELEAEATL